MCGDHFQYRYWDQEGTPSALYHKFKLFKRWYARFPRKSFLRFSRDVIGSRRVQTMRTSHYLLGICVALRTSPKCAVGMKYEYDAIVDLWTLEYSKTQARCHLVLSGCNIYPNVCVECDVCNGCELQKKSREKLFPIPNLPQCLHFVISVAHNGRCGRLESSQDGESTRCIIVYIILITIIKKSYNNPLFDT